MWRSAGYVADPPDEFRSGSLVERHWAMTWAQRLMRVFKLDLERYEGCGG